MGISDQHVTVAKTVLTFLSWKRIFKIAIIAFVAVALVLAWLAREIIFDQKPPANFSKVALLNVSTNIKSDIDSIVSRNDHILAIQVITVNFQKNIRSETYASIDNPALQVIYDRFLNNKVIETPLFSENKMDNNRIIRLINGDFVCIPYKDSVAYKHAPEAANLITDICAIGIPPSYGEFSGIITIYLRDHPDKELTEQLFLLSRDISLRIFDDNNRAPSPHR